MLFEIFVNNLLPRLQLPSLFIFAVESINDMLLTLKHKSEKTLRWFMEDQIIVNPDKYQAMILQLWQRLYI